MKIAVLTSGILPVPAVQGGAVENHLDFLLRYNTQHQLHDITVYSVYDKGVDGHEDLRSSANHYEYIHVDSLWAKIMKRFYHLTNKDGYYSYTIEYYFRQAWKRLRRQHYDIILLENRPGYALSMDIPKETRLVVYLHNDFLNSDTRGCREIYRKAWRIITVSAYIANRVKTINRDDTKCIPILNGIDTQAFHPDRAMTIDRSRLGLSERDFVIIFSGRISPEKGIHELISAMAALSAYPAIKLLIIGSPFYGNAKNEDSYVRALKQEAKQIEDRIVFTGFIRYEQMPGYYHMADIAVVPSMWDDPCPFTVLEAQAAGLPIVTTKRGGIPEEVTEDNALLLSTDETFIDRLAEAILHLYSHPEQRARMSAKALANATKYTKQRLAEDFFQVINE